MERASEEMWNWIEGLPKDKQRKYLQSQLQAREPIHSFKDIRLGDHLVRKDSFLGLVSYEHHFICVGFNDEGKPMIVHYHNTAWKATAQLIPSISASGSPIEQMAMVQEMCIEKYVSEAKLQTKGNEVARVVWPEELLRYPPEERAERARERASFRVGGSIGGMILGQWAPIPVLGGIIGNVLGCIFGHLASKWLPDCGVTKFLAEQINNWLGA